MPPSRQITNSFSTTVLGAALTFVAGLSITAIADAAHGGWKQAWTLIGVAIAAIGFVVALMSALAEQKGEIDDAFKNLQQSSSNLERHVEDARHISALLGEYMPIQTTTQMKAAKELLASIRRTHVDGLYPIQDDYRSDISLDVPTNQVPDHILRGSDVAISWAVCTITETYTLNFESSHPDAISSIVPFRAVAITDSFIDLNQVGLTQWAHYYPFGGDIWAALCESDRHALKCLNWLAPCGDTGFATNLVVHNGDERGKTLNFGLHEMLPSETAGRQKAFDALVPRSDALKDWSFDGILQVYAPSEAAIGALRNLMADRSPRKLDVTNKLEYLLPVRAVRGSDVIYEMRKYEQPFQKTSKAYSQRFSLSKRYPAEFDRSSPPTIPLRARMLRSSGPEVRLDTNAAWGAELDGRYLYPAEGILWHWIPQRENGSTDEGQG